MEIRPKQPTIKDPSDWFTGDVVHTPSGEWHWHGAAPKHFMTHLSLTEGAPTWGEHVTDPEYDASAEGDLGRPSA